MQLLPESFWHGNFYLTSAPDAHEVKSWKSIQNLFSYDKIVCCHMVSTFIFTLEMSICIFLFWSLAPIMLTFNDHLVFGFIIIVFLLCIFHYVSKFLETNIRIPLIFLPYIGIIYIWFKPICILVCIGRSALLRNPHFYFSCRPIHVRKANLLNHDR